MEVIELIPLELIREWSKSTGGGGGGGPEHFKM